MRQAPCAIGKANRVDSVWPDARPAVMGILNCTPDSFSDGGHFADSATALAHAETMLDEGADLIDVGGESTRPGSAPVSAAEERQRVVPVIIELRRRRPSATISVDTSKPEVAAAALAAGADLVNDVTGASHPEMLWLVAEAEAGVVLMHMRGQPRTMQQDTHYTDVVREVHAYLLERAAAAVASGIPPDRVWLDPGIGFGKDEEGNLALLAALPRLAAHGHPVVVGPSRKSFIGRLSGAPVERRLPGTLAALLPVLGLERCAVRVHEPGAVRQFLAIAARLHGATP